MNKSHVQNLFSILEGEIVACELSAKHSHGLMLEKYNLLATSIDYPL